MRFNLNGVVVVFEIELVGDDVLSKCRPVFVGIGDVVCIEVANGTVHLGQKVNFFNVVDGSFQSKGNVGHFLTDGCRAGVLSVSSGQHRDRSPIVSKCL